jgi:XTP/dITP diphosphohydrolase
MQLVLASNNAKKLSELRVFLGDLGVTLLSQRDLGLAEADEPHDTFIENALAKARHAAAGSGLAAIADDSGVCVNALGGAPGVVSEHFAPAAGAGLSGLDREAQRALQDAANNSLLLQQLQGVADRSARFVSTLVAVRHAGDPEPLVAVGRWPGQILSAPRGAGGFGYDPLMFIPELDCTVAQMDAALKNAHSHRARAFAQMRALLREAWSL